MRRNKRAQSFIEFAAIIAIMVAAIIVINRYLARSLQGKYRDTADVFGGGTQYAPGVTVETQE